MLEKTWDFFGAYKRNLICELAENSSENQCTAAFVLRHINALVLSSIAEFFYILFWLSFETAQNMLLIAVAGPIGFRYEQPCK